MTRNGITNTLIGVLATIVLAFGQGIRSDVAELKTSMTKITTAYNIELPSIKKDILANSKDIQLHHAMLFLPTLTAKKEDE